MQLALNPLSETIFFLVFIAGIGSLLIRFAWPIIQDLPGSNKNVKSAFLTRKMDNYFRDKGYVVWNITPVKNSNRWLAFLVKNGDYMTATVLTSGESIEVIQDTQNNI